MKAQRLAVALTALNLVLLLVLLAHGRWAAAETSSTLRAQVIELVDRHGAVRAQLKVEASGEAVLRMRDAGGNIRVKLGASQDGSGLLLANQATEPGVHILSDRRGSKLLLRNADGRERVLQPE